MGLYVLSCKAGQEETLIRFCKQHLSGKAMEDTFQFSYERMKKYLGEWHTDRCPLFPGDIFFQSQEPEHLAEELRNCRTITEALASDKLLFAVSPEEEACLQILCGEEHLLALSQGTLQKDGTFTVLHGPLKGRESWIRKVDLHKRVAVLSLVKPGSDRAIWAGIDLKKDK